MTSRISVRIVTASIGLAVSPPATSLMAQSLASRVTASEGAVQVIYPSRPNACGDGAGSISNVFGITRMTTGDATWSGRNGWTMRQCVHGPARLVVTVVGTEVTRVRTYVGPVPPAPTDVRTITASAAEAIAWTTDVVAHGNARVASEMILPLILADGPEPWPALLKVARDDNRPRELRRSVMIWLSNGVSDHLGIIDADGGASDDDEMRNQAIYVLTQRPKDESVPALIELARSLKHPSARKTAIYWLGQSGDPRAIEVYAELLGLR